MSNVTFRELPSLKCLPNRAERIRQSFLAHKQENGNSFFKDDGAFSCGSQIAYEMRNDENAMWQAAMHLIDFIEYKGDDFFKTFGDHDIIFARDLLLDRLEKYSTPKSITGGLQPDSVTGINQVSEPERVDSLKCDHTNVISVRYAYKCTNCGLLLEPE